MDGASQTVTECLVFQMKVPKESNTKEQVAFRILLLNRCQREFEKDNTDEQEFKEKQKAIDAATDVSIASLIILTHCVVCWLVFTYHLLIHRRLRRKGYRKNLTMLIAKLSDVH